MLCALKAGRNFTKEIGTGLQTQLSPGAERLSLKYHDFQMHPHEHIVIFSLLLLIQLSMEEGKVILHLLASYSAE